LIGEIKMGDNLIYKTKFAIGDWSYDDHGRSDWFLVSSNKTVEQLREAHFKAKEVIGFDPGAMCGSYEEYSLSKEHIEKLKAAGVSLEIDGTPEVPSTTYLLILWLECLRVAEPDLLYIIHDDDEVPTMHFYGVDEKGRYVNVPGYGLLS